MGNYITSFDSLASPPTILSGAEKTGTHTWAAGK